MKFNLDKQNEKVQLVLQKRNLPTMRASVGITLDISGSTQGLYKRGTMQRVVENLIPVGIKFDDNGNLDVRTFADGDTYQVIGSGATAANYDGFVKREILDNGQVAKWGGTDYAPVIESMLRDYGFYEPAKKGWFGGSTPSNTLRPNSTSGEAVLNYIITDGENGDKSETRAILRAAQDAKCNIYFMFIGVGSERFQFIRDIADEFGNVGFLSVADLDKLVDSDDVYEQLLPQELTGWLAQKKV